MSTPAQAPVLAPAQVIERFLGALGARDPGSAVALAAPGVAVAVYPLHVDATGPAALHEVLGDLVRAFPDLLITVDRIITTGGGVVTALFKAEGTQAADYAGAINQEKHLDIDQAWRFTVSGGRITEVHAFWCQGQMYRRLAVKRFDEIAIV